MVSPKAPTGFRLGTRALASRAVGSNSITSGKQETIVQALNCKAALRKDQDRRPWRLAGWVFSVRREGKGRDKGICFWKLSDFEAMAKTWLLVVLVNTLLVFVSNGIRAEMLGEANCEDLGFTGLALCSDCDSLAEYVKDQGRTEHHSTTLAHNLPLSIHLSIYLSIWFFALCKMGNLLNLNLQSLWL